MNKIAGITQIPYVTLVSSLKEELPGEIWGQIFQFLTEREGRNVMLTSKQFRHLELSYSPYLNIINIAFNLRCHGLTEFDTPSLIKNEEFPLFTTKELSRITRQNKQNNILSYIFLAKNKSLSLKLVNQIVKCTKWNLEELETFLPTHPLTKLCNQILTVNINDEKEKINKSEFLATALANISFTGQLMWERLYDTKSETDYRSKIDVLIAVSLNGHWIDRADMKLREDKEVVLAACKNYSEALRYADESLKKDKELLLEVVKHKGYVLKWADESLRKDKEIVLEAVKQAGSALQFADNNLKKDKEIALAAVMEAGWWAVEFIDETLKRDREVLAIALERGIWKLNWAHDSLKKDKELMLEVVKLNPEAYGYVEYPLKYDPDILKAAGRESYCSIL